MVFWWCRLDDFRREMLKDDHIKLIYDFSKLKRLLPWSRYKWCVCFFLRDSSYSGECEFTNVTNGVISTKREN